MKRRLTLREAIAFTAILACPAFQNCSPVAFQAPAAATKALGADAQPTYSVLPDATPSVSSGSASQSSTAPDAPTAFDSSCAEKVAGPPAIVYDSLPVANSAPVSFTTLPLLGGPTSINAENISEVIGILSNLNVVARTIQNAQSIVGGLNVNAQELVEFGGAVDDIVVAAHKFDHALGVAGRICASAQTIDTIASAVGEVSLYGRTEDGQASTISTLQDLAQRVSVHSFDVALVQGAVIDAYFANSHVTKLAVIDGRVTLSNSQVDTLAGFIGVVYADATSKIGSTAGFTGKIVHF